MHVPVLLDEVLHWLVPQPGGFFVDGTLGGGGHTEALARAVGPSGLVLGMDRDCGAIDATEQRIRNQMETEGVKWSIRYAHANYADLPEALEMLKIKQVDGVLLDLGLSSDQLADRNRGFSFESDGPLDLRFDTTEGEPTFEFLEYWGEERIANVIYEFGEEKYSRRIAREIVKSRENGQPIRTASELAELVRRCVPKQWKTSGNRHSVSIDPATRTFQALRIATNDELGSLAQILREVSRFLKVGGRIAIISFHSLEDRIVKNAFRDDPLLENLTKKPITATETEMSINARSRSAKLRVAARI